MATTDMPETLKRQFEENGYFVMRALLAGDIVDGVKAEMAKLVERLAAGLVQAGTVPHGFREEPFETRMARLYERNLDQAPKSFRENLHLAGMFPLFFHPGLLDVVGRLLGPEIRLYPNYTARPKLPEWKGTEVLWHQDAGYTASRKESGDVTSMRMVNVWTPLVPARVENGCMQFVPGTHRLGVVAHEAREHYLEIVPEVLKPHLARAVSIELDPGDVVLFHNLLFHCGLPNRANTIRWSVDWRYQDARQSTQRTERGHLARSSAHPELVVKSAEQWTRLTFS